MRFGHTIEIEEWPKIILFDSDLAGLDPAEL